MPLRPRTLLLVAGLALSFPTLFASGDDHAPAAPAPAHAAPKADDHAAPVPSTPPAPAHAAQSKPRSSIWEAGRTAKPKPAESHDEAEHSAPGRASGGAAKKPVQSVRTDPVDVHGAGTAAHHADASSTPTADEALALLTQGNQRWVDGTTTNPSTDAERREALAENGQHPFVTILTCADSRIPVERVFDRGVGELFVVRVAGNVAGSSETGTIEYGVGHLKTRLLVVMGHTKCGAVAAACSGAELHGHVVPAAQGSHDLLLQHAQKFALERE